ncbi:MAG: DUF5908 family protein [Chitinophagaceae bacterium]
MPVVINEIQITAYVSEQSPAQQAGGSPAAANGGGSTLPPEKLIERCVEEVLRILQQKEER